MRGDCTYGTEQSLLMRLLAQLNTADAHSCLRQCPFLAACVPSRTCSSYLLLNPRHPEYDLDLMILLQGCSCLLTALQERRHRQCRLRDYFPQVRRGTRGWRGLDM